MDTQTHVSDSVHVLHDTRSPYHQHTVYKYEKQVK